MLGRSNHAVPAELAGLDVVRLASAECCGAGGGMMRPALVLQQAEDDDVPLELAEAIPAALGLTIVTAKCAVSTAPHRQMLHVGRASALTAGN